MNTSDTSRKEREGRTDRLVIILSAVACSLTLPWALYAIINKKTTMAILDSTTILLSIVAIILIIKTNHKHIAKLLFITSITALIIIATVFVEGVGLHDENGHYYYLLPLAPGTLIIFQDTNNRIKTTLLLLFLLIFLSIQFQIVPITPQNPLSPETHNIGTHFSKSAALLFTMILAWIYSSEIHKTEKRMEAANSAIEDVLGSMLPEQIVTRLRSHKGGFTDEIDCCSIMFAKIEGIPASDYHNPAILMSKLNTIFSKLDELTHQFYLEKIKTIGETYMVASRSSEIMPDHAKTMTKLAIYFQEEIQKHQGLTLKIGINSGPIVGGVIGKKRYIYDVWGDAVNIASRLENSGEAGTITVSLNTLKLLDEQFNITSTKRIKVKGKGYMDVFTIEKNLT